MTISDHLSLFNFHASYPFSYCANMCPIPCVSRMFASLASEAFSSGLQVQPVERSLSLSGEPSDSLLEHGIFFFETYAAWRDFRWNWSGPEPPEI